MSKEAKRLPYFRFFSTDWRGDVPLRMCSYAARGLWIDLLTLMHESDRTGYLLIAGQKPTPRQLASLLGGSEKEVVKLLAELEKAGIFSIDDDTGCIVSRRMIRDRAKEEKDRENGRGGGNPKLKAKDIPPGNPEGLTPKSNPGVNPSDKAHGRSSTSTTTSKERISPPSTSVPASASSSGGEQGGGDAEALAIIAAFDESRTAAYGAEKARPWPASTDLVAARRMVEAGATASLARHVFDSRNAKLKATGHGPRATLKAFENDLTEAMKDRPAPPATNGHARPSALPDPDSGFVKDVLLRVARKRTGAEALRLRQAYDADRVEGLKAIQRVDRELRGEGRGGLTEVDRGVE